MGRYTLHEEPIVDTMVNNQLSVIRDYLLGQVRADALLLSGSFGRGEGSVYVDGPEVVFFSDYEINVVAADPRVRRAVQKCQETLETQGPTPVSLGWMTPSRLRANRCRNLSFGRPLPSIASYEIKAGSQVMAGHFDLSYGLLEPDRLPPCEGIRLIKNRMMEFLEHRYRGADGTRLAFCAAKLALACGDGLLLQHGLYHYSYAERARRFLSGYAPEVADAPVADLLGAYERAASFKLHPFEKYDGESILASLPIIRRACRATLDALATTQCRECTARTPACYAPARLPGAAPLSYRCGLGSHLDRWFEDAVAAARLHRAGLRVRWNRLGRMTPALSLPQLLYLAIPMFFFALDVDGPDHESGLRLGAGYVRWAADLELPETLENRTRFVTNLCRIWHAIS
jgi:hypothetical protein